MNETIFFEYEDVKVTNARFINSNQIYSISNITSIKVSEEASSRAGGVICFFVGLLIAALGFYIIGFLVSLVCGVYLYGYKKRVKYSIVLMTAAGEVTALATYQRDYLDKVMTALNLAIVART